MINYNLRESRIMDFEVTSEGSIDLDSATYRILKGDVPVAEGNCEINNSILSIPWTAEAEGGYTIQITVTAGNTVRVFTDYIYVRSRI